MTTLTSLPAESPNDRPHPGASPNIHPAAASSRTDRLPFWLQTMLRWFLNTGRLRGWTAIRLLDWEHRNGGHRTKRGQTTNGATLVRQVASNNATGILAAGEKRIDKLAASTDKLAARGSALLYAAARISTRPVTGVRGANLTVASAATKAAKLHASIEDDEDKGNKRHHPVSRARRFWFNFFTVVVDFPIWLWFASSIANVRWARVSATPMELAISIVFAVIATGGVALSLNHFGHSLREHKNSHRELTWSTLTTPAKRKFVQVYLLVVVTGATMFVRVYSESIDSGLPGLITCMFALCMALVMLYLAEKVYDVAFCNGSLERDDLIRCTQLIQPHLARQRQLEEQAADIARQIETQARTAERDRSRTHVQASQPPRTADEWIDLWRTLNPESDPIALDVVDPDTDTRAVGHHAETPQVHPDHRSMTTSFGHVQNQPIFAPTPADPWDELSTPEPPYTR